MLERIFPKTIDNRFRGLPVALWLLVPLLLLRLVIGTNSILNTVSVATTADGIPLAHYGADAAAQVVQLFALLGLAWLVTALLGVVVLLRYRAMIPLFYLMLTVQLIGTRAIHLVRPTVEMGATTVGSTGISAGAIVSTSLMAMIVVGFVLSLFGRRYNETAA